jgi:hypothetical protein
MHWGTEKYKILISKAQGKKQLGRPRPIWDNNIKMNIREIGSYDGIF